MAPHSPHRHSLDQWLRRLDRAAAAMNPLLTVLAVGLAVLNLTCIALLSIRLTVIHEPVIHEPMGPSYCPPAFDCTPGAAVTKRAGRQ